MKTLFQYESQDNNPQQDKKSEVKAIIVKDEKVLLAYSKKNTYFMFPSGKVNKDENHATTLLREIKKVTGLSIIPKTIKDFGRVSVHKKNEVISDETCIQETFYYFCDIESNQEAKNFSDSQDDEDFSIVWMDINSAIKQNQYGYHKDGDLTSIKYEAKVLDLLDLELRNQKYIAHEKATVQSLGNLDYADMLSFVADQLDDLTTEDIGNKVSIAYSRMEHSKRVLGWAKRLYEMSEIKNKLDYEAIIISAIFHDVGRNVEKKQNISHAHAGVPITRDYLLSHGFDAERVEYICFLVESHSDKQLMHKADIDQNLLLLMEADLLDDTGALGIMMDCMITEKRNPKATFADCFTHISRFTYRLQQYNPMVTVAARKIWDRKTALVDEFVSALKEDIFL